MQSNDLDVLRTRLMMADMADYWIFEDLTVHTASVHRCDCPYCNHGAGMGRGRIERDSRRLGPYNSEAQIRSYQGKLDAAVVRREPPRDELALAWLG